MNRFTLWGIILIIVGIPLSLIIIGWPIVTLGWMLLVFGWFYRYFKIVPGSDKVEEKIKKGISWRAKKLKQLWQEIKSS